MVKLSSQSYALVYWLHCLQVPSLTSVSSLGRAEILSAQTEGVEDLFVQTVVELVSSFTRVEEIVTGSLECLRRKFETMIHQNVCVYFEANAKRKVHSEPPLPLSH